MIKKSILIWALIIPLAILNGGLREKVLIPWIGERCAEPISGTILCILILIVSLIFIPRIGKGESKIYWKIGILWIALTIIFEFIFGITTGHSFSELLKAYDITTGNLWLIIVIFTGIAPWLVAKIKRII
ncbi:MAG: hypothetical protein FWE63_00930 [Bacteroidales bacterium]|nr:hypothetical protein [Bacteroidales bacterium]